MIKAVFFDLDGTLLNSKKELSSKTKSVLVKCRESGIKLFVATARPPILGRSLCWDDSVLSLFDGGSYYNGGCVVMGNEKHYTPISTDIVKKCIDEVTLYKGVNIALQLENEKHAFRYPLKDEDYMSWGLSAEEALTLDQINDMQTIKILVFYANLIDSVTPIDRGLVDSLEKLCIDTARFYLTDKGKCVQIMARSVNKLGSITSIMSVLGLTKNEIISFGDDINDIEMLREGGIGVAVANAADEVKAVADHICDTNDNDGVARWLEGMLNV